MIVAEWCWNAEIPDAMAKLLEVGETWQDQESGLSRTTGHSAWDSSLGSPPSTTRSAARRYSHTFESGGRSSSESPGRRGLRFPGIRKMRASAVDVAGLVRQTYRKAEQVVLRKLRRASLSDVIRRGSGLGAPAYTHFDISRSPSRFSSPFCPLLHQSRPSRPFACSSPDCGSSGVLRHRPPRASVCSYLHMARRSSRRCGSSGSCELSPDPTSISGPSSPISPTNARLSDCFAGRSLTLRWQPCSRGHPPSLTSVSFQATGASRDLCATSVASASGLGSLGSGKSVFRQPACRISCQPLIPAALSENQIKPCRPTSSSVYPRVTLPGNRLQPVACPGASPQEFNLIDSAFPRKMPTQILHRMWLNPHRPHPRDPGALLFQHRCLPPTAPNTLISLVAKPGSTKQFPTVLLRSPFLY